MCIRDRFNYFDEHFDENQWDPGLIIFLCDSIFPEVQDFGTHVLGKYFKDEHGEKYLLALSEHPDPIIQLYCTNYLDRYAHASMEKLNRLRDYFERILHSVNVKRVAKLRVFHFLKKQSLLGVEYGKYVADLLNHLIGSIAVSENERYVELLYAIKMKYPDVEADIQEVPLEIRD